MAASYPPAGELRPTWKGADEKEMNPGAIMNLDAMNLGTARIGGRVLFVLAIRIGPNHKVFDVESAIIETQSPTVTD